MTSNAVLVVDDSEPDRYVLKRQLKRTGLVGRVFEEEDGQSAIEFFIEYEENRRAFPDDYPPIIVFLDINMPRKNGHQFLAEFDDVRKSSDLNALTIMMFSSSDRDDDRGEAMAYEFVADYLVKGEFSTQDLAKKIAPYLQ